MMDFPRLFFWRKLRAISWKQTTCLSRLVETTVCRATISRSAILKLLSYIYRNIIATACIRWTFQAQYIALRGISRGAIKLPMLTRTKFVMRLTHKWVSILPYFFGIASLEADQRHGIECASIFQSHLSDTSWSYFLRFYETSGEKRTVNKLTFTRAPALVKIFFRVFYILRYDTINM